MKEVVSCWADWLSCLSVFVVVFKSQHVTNLSSSLPYLNVLYLRMMNGLYYCLYTGFACCCCTYLGKYDFSSYFPSPLTFLFCRINVTFILCQYLSIKLILIHIRKGYIFKISPNLKIFEGRTCRKARKHFHFSFEDMLWNSLCARPFSAVTIHRKMTVFVFSIFFWLVP